MIWINTVGTELVIVAPVTQHAVPDMTSFSEDLLRPGFTWNLTDMDLAAKYTCQGPRYTSYPTAPQFRQDFQRDQYDNWQNSDGKHKGAPLSLYIHLPFCNDICYYCACNKIVTREKNARATTCDASKPR